MKTMISYRYDTVIKKNKSYLNKKTTIQLYIGKDKKFQPDNKLFEPKMKIEETIKGFENKPEIHLNMLFNLLYTLSDFYHLV